MICISEKFLIPIALNKLYLNLISLMSQETWETKAEVLGKPNLGEDILNTYNPRIRK